MTATMRLNPEQVAQIRQSAAESFGQEADGPCGHGAAKPLT